MSKDKGNKDKKKSPANKAGDKLKARSAYKMEGKAGAEKTGLLVFNPKSDGKPGPSPKT